MVLFIDFGLEQEFHLFLLPQQILLLLQLHLHPPQLCVLRKPIVSFLLLLLGHLFVFVERLLIQVGVLLLGFLHHLDGFLLPILIQHQPLVQIFALLLPQLPLRLLFLLKLLLLLRLRRSFAFALGSAFLVHYGLFGGLGRHLDVSVLGRLLQEAQLALTIYLH
mmetsp:Transcript_6361/g.5666  ORF Transcript_6361/g.5666 Transcript_6361/m.5666 type:complete len:164 (-) Transcript_6361:734-1225(-)